MRAFCDVVMAQDSEPHIPVLKMVDEKLPRRPPGRSSHHDMPQDPETWQQVAADLDEWRTVDMAAGRSSPAPSMNPARRSSRRFANGELDWGLHGASLTRSGVAAW